MRTTPASGRLALLLCVRVRKQKQSSRLSAAVIHVDMHASPKLRSDPFLRNSVLAPPRCDPVFQGGSYAIRQRLGTLLPASLTATACDRHLSQRRGLRCGTCIAGSHSLSPRSVSQLIYTFSCVIKTYSRLHCSAFSDFLDLSFLSRVLVFSTYRQTILTKSINSTLL